MAKNKIIGVHPREGSYHVDLDTALADLGNAIIIQAIEDYVNDIITENQLKQFMKSDWFLVLTNVPWRTVWEKACAVKGEWYAEKRKAARAERERPNNRNRERAVNKRVAKKN